MQDKLADSVLQSRGLMMKYVNGFDDETHTKVAVNLPNHVAWCLGHCALTMHRAAERVDGLTLFGDDFSMNQRDSTARSYGSESIAFRSTPTPDEASYPPFLRCTVIYSNAINRLADAIRACANERLDDIVPFNSGMSLPRWNVGPRSVFHNGMHCGQIADLRRAFGMPSVFD